MTDGPLDVRAELAALGTRERAVLKDRLDRAAAPVVVATGAISIGFFLALMVLDARRHAAGLLAARPLYLWLLATHVAVGVSALPAGLLWWRRRADPSECSRSLQRAHMALAGASLLAMGLLGVVERGTLVQVAVALVLINVIFTLRAGVRTAFNVVALVAGLAVIHAQPAVDEFRPLLMTIELAALAVTVHVSGRLLNDQRLASALAERRLSQIVHVDALTGVASRRRVEEALAAQLARASEKAPLSIVVVDIDHFKSVNDAHGHNAGDDVLRGLARLMQQRVRIDDLIGRWGGEEFVVVCPRTRRGDAAALAESLRVRLERHEFPAVGARTASFGVAEAERGDTPASLVERADRALYEAKRAGRNRVVVEGSRVPVPAGDAAAPTDRRAFPPADPTVDVRAP